MTESPSFQDWQPPRISALQTMAVVAAPIVGAIAAGALLGINWLVVVAAIVAVPSAMLLSRTYTIDLGVRTGRSWRSATLGMLHSTDPPGRLERLYVPVLAACVAGSLAELLLAGSVVLGALEGGFLSLAMLLSWALACVALSRRLGRAA
jgi:hypothetical protein